MALSRRKTGEDSQCLYTDLQNHATLRQSKGVLCHSFLAHGIVKDWPVTVIVVLRVHTTTPRCGDWFQRMWKPSLN
jgi:hypothetical protein